MALALMYFVSMDPASGKLTGLEMVSTRIRQFRSNRAGETDSDGLKKRLNRQNKQFNNYVEKNSKNNLLIDWQVNENLL